VTLTCAARSSRSRLQRASAPVARQTPARLAYHSRAPPKSALRSLFPSTRRLPCQIGQTDLAEHCAAPPAVPGVRRPEAPADDLAHLPTHVLVLVARPGGARQGGGSADGSREGRHGLNVYTQVLDAWLRSAAGRVALIVRDCSLARKGGDCKSLTEWVA